MRRESARSGFMNKVSKVLTCLSVCLFMLFSFGCGSKKSPTGGKIDIVKPELNATLPTEFSDISGGKIELTFSKELDKASVTRGLYIYPLIDNKTISVEGNRVVIRIREKLLKDTNYYVTLTPRIKDLRDNPLAKNQTLVFASGELQTGRIAGMITYEEPTDKGKPIQFTLYSADQVMVRSAEFSSETYAVENLNQGKYSWNAYIDKNINGHFDQDTDPVANGSIDLRQMASVDITLAYTDTTAVKISSVMPVSSTEIRIKFSERVASIGSVVVFNKSGVNLPIKAACIEEKEFTLITTPAGNEVYTAEFRDVKDMKSNLSKVLRVDLQGSVISDRKAPLILSSNPRTGTSVNSDSPVLSVGFDEVMDPESMVYSLTSADGKITVPLKIDMSGGKIARFTPELKLQKNKEYTLTLGRDSADGAGNKLAEDHKIDFMVLLGN